jgi:hypothetical protein
MSEARPNPHEVVHQEMLQVFAKEERMLDAEKIRQEFIKSKRLPKLSASISLPISDQPR